MADVRDLVTVRHSVTGLTQRVPRVLALADSHLTIVDDDAKPLAYVPIPQEAIEEYFASESEDSEEE